MIDAGEILPFLRGGKLTGLPAKRRKKIFALCWLAEHIPQEKAYTEAEFNELLEHLHSFGDPALLRRELCDLGLVSRSADGRTYRLSPDCPSPDELAAKYCGEAAKPAPQEEQPPRDFTVRPPIAYSESDLADAAGFRERIHAQALERVRLIRPEAEAVVDRYPAEAYLQQHWDYPGTWYTVAAIPESVKSREALIDTIVRETLAQYR